MKKHLLLALGLFIYGTSRSQFNVNTSTTVTTPVSHGVTLINPPNGSLTITTGGVWIFNGASGASLFSSSTSPTTNIITFQNGGIPSNASLGNGFIDGYAAVVNPSSSFVLPLGNSSFIPFVNISINTTFSPLRVGAATGTLSAAFRSGNPVGVTLVVTPITVIGSASYYDIHTTNMTSGKLSFPQPATSSFTTGSTVCVAGYNIANNQWEKIGPNATYLPGSLISTFGSTNLTLYSHIALGFISPFTLPVTLESFTGAVNNCTAILNWKTSEEMNSSYFDVETSSDGSTFTSAGTVKSKNSELGASYSYVADLSSGVNYYRLKSVDIDGKFAYSQIISLRSACGVSGIVVWPNPATTTVNVSGLTGVNNITLYDANGGRALSLTSTGSIRQIDIGSLAHGTYVLRVVDEKGNATSLKVVKK